MLALVFLPFFFASNMAQVLRTQPCGSTTMENLNFTLYNGLWYEHLYSPGFDRDLKCENEDYDLNPDGTGTVAVRWQNTSANDETTVRRFTSRFDGSQLHSTSVTDPSFEFDIEFLSTDYVSYSIMANCVDAGSQSAYIYWVFSRSRQPLSQTVLEEVNRQLEVLGIPREYFEPMDQTNCTDV